MTNGGESKPSMASRVLVVDDDLPMAETIAEGLQERGYEAVPCASSTDANVRLESEVFDAVVTDLRMPRIDGMGLLSRSKRSAPHRPVIVMTGHGAIESAIDAIRHGAYHYMTKPFTVDELELFLHRALDDASVRAEARRLRDALSDRVGLGGMVATGPAMREVFDLAMRVANAATPILILGETGTGKTALAKAIHGVGARAARPFVAVNCAALPESLLESELFGHAKGAFTGATSDRAGLFAEADGGTLLLDEVGEMSPSLQAKLLHVIEAGTIRAVGASKDRAVDVRILAATHRDLRERALTGAFREDLLYRLDVVAIELPALRHRRHDLPLLIEHLFEQTKLRHPHSPVERFAVEAMAKLIDYPWPGNVRELAHAIERVVLLGRDPQVRVSDLPSNLTGARSPDALGILEGRVLGIRAVQRRYAAWALDKLGGHKARTAEALGIDVKTLGKWLSAE